MTFIQLSAVLVAKALVGPSKQLNVYSAYLQTRELLRLHFNEVFSFILLSGPGEMTILTHRCHVVPEWRILKLQHVN